MTKKKLGFLHRNGLGLTLLGLLLITLTGQLITGWRTHNDEREEHGLHRLDLPAYLGSPHFLSSTFENWESEFLQMGLYVLLTVKLYQVGSSESKDPDKEEEVDREPRATPDAPWPVRRGGLILMLYEYSLSIAFFLLFTGSFLLHFRGSYGKYREEELAQAHRPESSWQYLSDHRFWFESFQNWQSEFMAVGSIVVLSIWLRQKGSPESKPVDAAHSDTGK